MLTRLRRGRRMLISPMIFSRRKAMNWPRSLGDLLIGQGFEILDQLF
jgi:hypothetical protein